MLKIIPRWIIRRMRSSLHIDNLEGQISTLQRHVTQLREDIKSLQPFNPYYVRDYRVDTQTPRVACASMSENPLLSCGAYPWMEGAVYDGRPLNFKSRRFIYFCGQYKYSISAPIVLGLAEWKGDSLYVHPAPVIYPDIESRGIHIPSFTVYKDQVLCLYQDNSGFNRTKKGIGTDFILAASDDGITFKKRIIRDPFSKLLKDYELNQFGFPWMLLDGEEFRVYFRAKKLGGEEYIIGTLFDPEGLTFQLVKVEQFNNPIYNVAVVKRDSTYILFYGSSCAGGFYITTSKDGWSWDSENSIMAVDPNDHGWRWDFNKMTVGPDNATTGPIETIYLGNVNLEMAIAEATVDWEILSKEIAK